MIISFIQKLRNDNAFAFLGAREKKNLKVDFIDIDII